LRIYATITAIDAPEPGFYQARTVFGRNISGVSLMGRDEPLNIGQQVQVYEVGGEFGALGGSYPSLLSMPVSLFPQAPASVSLAYLATLAGNTRKKYAVGTVTGVYPDGLDVMTPIGKTPRITGKVSVALIAPDRFGVDDKVLIDVSGKKPVVLGWWSLTNKQQDKLRAVFLHRPAFTARVALYEYAQDAKGTLELRRSQVFANKNLLSVRAVLGIQPTTDADDYYYCTATMQDAAFNVTEFYYLAFSKDFRNVLELSQSEYPPSPGTPYSRTADNKFWWARQEDVFCLQSDTVDGEKYQVFNGPFDQEGQWMPLKGQIYTAL